MAALPQVLVVICARISGGSRVLSTRFAGEVAVLLIQGLIHDAQHAPEIGVLRFDHLSADIAVIEVAEKFHLSCSRFSLK
ncbi:hypothetical protein EJB05_50886 [Eragrostis curvula]|uniref:Uncharacterized protein n=1 Tax=Eragrostis curvula TaxID=38414 RepID=A0A5J9SX69_9POAL|nr:hypothetical protein EJB05_50886 [Eragrostis curvula]